ncbi:MAG: Holliday junction resolvase RuvX [Armatimonadetes bacterium]|nr:Holliday junction resolvase RuvX [Armatimonadota bacterium]
MSRILSIDFGSKRIGLALSDPLKILASPMGFILVSSKGEIYHQLLKIIQDYEVEKIIVGIPLTLKGLESKQTKKVNGFIKELKKYIDLPIEEVDERLSSKEVEQILKQVNLSQTKKRQKIDALSASIILQSYLAKINQKENKGVGKQNF